MSLVEFTVEAGEAILHFLSVCVHDSTFLLGVVGDNGKAPQELNISFRFI